jgi:hypothetical protein
MPVWCMMTFAMTSAAGSLPSSPRKPTSWRSRLFRSGSFSSSAASLKAFAKRAARLSALSHCPTTRLVAAVNSVTDHESGIPPVASLSY